MSAVFVKILNMSIAAGFIVLAVLILRFALKKAPRWAVCLLWGIVALRLLIPFNLTSSLSLIPSAETVKQSGAPYSPPVVDSGFSFVNSAVNPAIGRAYESAGLTQSEAYVPADPGAASETPARGADPVLVASIVWAAGAALMLAYMAFSRLRLEKRTAARLGTEKGVFVCDGLASPFILGVIRPRIFMPSGLGEGESAIVLAHERAHIARFDHIWKPVGFILLSIHWFNPLMWLAYALLCRDIELACDEKVIRTMDEGARAAYSNALLGFSTRSRLITACPLAFGEVGAKERIKKVLSFKKPTVWIIILAVTAAAVTAVCFLTDPKKEASDMVKCMLTEDFDANDPAKALIAISRADEEFLMDIFEGGGWQEWEYAAGDYMFKVGGRTIYYSSEARVFTDREKSAFRTVGYDDWTRLNSILGRATDIPFRTENAEGHSSDPNVRVGVAGMSFGLHNTITAVFDVTGGNEFEYGEFCCLYKRTGESYERVPVRTDYGFNCIAYSLLPHSFNTHTYYLDCFGDLDAGEYRLYLNGSEPTGMWIDFTLDSPVCAPYPESAADQSGDPERLAVLREEYPEFFGLEGNSLTIYAMDPGRGRYYLSKELDLSEYGEQREIASKLLGRGVCADDMRLILSQYGAAQMFDIVPVRNPLSSTFFVYEIAIARFRMELNGTEEYTPEEAAVRLEELRQEYPEYFGVRTGKGLEVYVCQFGPGSFEFILLSGTNFNREFAAGEYIMRYANYAHVRSFADMKLILSTYDIDDDAIRVIYFQHPLSSYIPDTQRGYIPAVRSLLGLSPIE